MLHMWIEDDLIFKHQIKEEKNLLSKYGVCIYVRACVCERERERE